MASGNPASCVTGQLGWMTVMIFSGLKIYCCSFQLQVATGGCSSRKRADSSPVRQLSLLILSRLSHLLQL